MASDEIVRHADEDMANAQAWLDYADKIEAQGVPDPTEVAMLNGNAVFGDLYDSFKQARLGLLTARQEAYQRVATHARLHAARLQSTVQAFNEQDSSSAASLNSVVD